MTGSPIPAQGEPVVRRQFDLPVDDVESLDALGLIWEAIVVGGAQWLIVHDWPLPGGLTATHATIAVRIIPGYPSAALDMVYVYPPLARADGRAIPALSPYVLDGVMFQQWSRHYTPANPWRVGIDSIVSHLRAADEWFRRAAS